MEHSGAGIIAFRYQAGGILGMAGWMGERWLGLMLVESRAERYCPRLPRPGS